ncbi:MAG TPA: hypothetical protein ENN46_00925 [Candidatus Woesearchaeota archaeon]|nr:hypothetical protein [Candidatus Woesearchaeota archaeon]
MKSKKAGMIPFFNVDTFSILLYFVVLFVFFVIFSWISPSGCASRTQSIEIPSDTSPFFTSELITSLEKGSGYFIETPEEDEQYRELKLWELLYYISGDEEDENKAPLFKEAEPEVDDLSSLEPEPEEISAEPSAPSPVIPGSTRGTVTPPSTVRSRTVADYIELIKTYPDEKETEFEERSSEDTLPNQPISEVVALSEALFSSHFIASRDIYFDSYRVVFGDIKKDSDRTLVDINDFCIREAFSISGEGIKNDLKKILLTEVPFNIKNRLPEEEPGIPVYAAIPSLREGSVRIPALALVCAPLSLRYELG